MKYGLAGKSGREAFDAAVDDGQVGSDLKKRQEEDAAAILDMMGMFGYRPK